MEDQYYYHGEVYSAAAEKKQIEEMARILCRFYTSEDDYCGKCPDCVVRDEAKRLYNAGYRKQEWISVDERLPDDVCGVYVCDEYGLMGEAYYCGRGRFEWAYSEDLETAYATHWMPLPEPPKGEQQ